jgi:hypothetical protein
MNNKVKKGDFKDESDWNMWKITQPSYGKHR